MTWREFQLRLIAYKRMEENKMLLARQMTYLSGYALHVNKPKNIEKFWPLKSDKKEVDETLIERMKKVISLERAKLKKT